HFQGEGAHDFVEQLHRQLVPQLQVADPDAQRVRRRRLHSLRAIAALASIMTSSSAFSARACSGEHGVAATMNSARSSTRDRMDSYRLAWLPFGAWYEKRFFNCSR